MGYWKIISPVAATNYVKNPIAMGSGNYSDVGANTRTTTSTTYSYLGYKSFRVVVTPATDNSGVNLTLSTLTNAIHYVTMRVRGTLPTAWDWSLDNSNFNNPTLLRTEGDWSVYGYQFSATQANASTSLRIYTNGTYSCDYYIGHVQVECSSYYTTPITGDIRGFRSDGYKWNGGVHLSSSTRSSQERGGGREYDLEDDYSLKVLYGHGTGMPPITHHIQPVSLLDGALYQGHKIEPRVLDLRSATKATTSATVSAVRKNIINLVKPDLVTPDQPVVLRYTGVNTSKPIDIRCYYDSGLEFQINSGVIDKPVIRLIAYDPFVYELNNASAVLTTEDTTSRSYFIKKTGDIYDTKVDGSWSSATGLTGEIYDAVLSPDGYWYLGGNFTNAGDSNGDYIVKWDPVTDTLTSMGTGANDVVKKIAISPNGDIYVGGLFTSMGGVANTNCIAYWDISAGTWNAVGTGIVAGTGYNVAALAFDSNNNLYIGGKFSNHYDSNGDYITKWDGSAYSSLGTGMNDEVYDLIVDYAGNIYAAGQFTTAGGTTVNCIAKWNGSAWSALGTGLSGSTLNGQAMCFNKAGYLYVSGSFDSADGVSANNIARWTGKTFEPLGSGVNAECQNCTMDDNDILFASGAMTTAGGIPTTGRTAIWNGSTWCNTDHSFTGTTIRKVIPVKNDLYFAISGSETSYSYPNTVTNAGSSIAYPIIKVKRGEDGTSARVAWFKNTQTGATLYLYYQLLKGETLTIDLTPGSRTITSDFFGPVWRALLRASDLSSFYLLPGANTIEAYVYTSGSPTITCWMEYKVTHWAADMVAA